MQAGYPCLSLHGGKEQSDRECTIADFKGAVCNILVATSVAARGLDVRELVLVVNYDVPNHHEDYVHRCVCVSVRVCACRSVLRVYCKQVHLLMNKTAHTGLRGTCRGT